jgi:CubicO group peptidase (beta-lactamase class C family)
MAQTEPHCDAPAQLDDGWSVSLPEEQGLDPVPICAIEDRLRTWTASNVHAIVVARHGVLVYEKYLAGEDQLWGKPLGRVVYEAGKLHDIRSVTKSITSLIVGIAVDRGWIKDLDASVFSFFPEYADLRTPEKDRITLRHLLMMATGLAWDESLPYSNPANSESQMYAARDPYRYVLERPVTDPPGEVYNYCTGASSLLGAVLRKATGKEIDQLQKEVLFGPLGITEAEWIKFDNGDVMSGGGLRLRARDLAKIGQLVLARGAWQGRQIVPASWIEESTAPQINGYGTIFYGYQWWLGRSFVKHREIDWVAGVGYGGQRLFIIPSEDVIAVVLAGHYDSSLLQDTVTRMVLNRGVLPAVVAH